MKNKCNDILKYFEIEYITPFYDNPVKFVFMENKCFENKNKIIFNYEIQLISLCKGLNNGKIIKKINIEYDDYVKILNKLLNLDYKNIILKNNIIGLDGSTLKIYFKFGSNSILLRIWNHNSNIKKRGLEDINEIFNELINKFNLNKRTINEYINKIYEEGQ